MFIQFEPTIQHDLTKLCLNFEHQEENKLFWIYNFETEPESETFLKGQLCPYIPFELPSLPCLQLWATIKNKSKWHFCSYVLITTWHICVAVDASFLCLSWQLQPDKCIAKNAESKVLRGSVRCYQCFPVLTDQNLISRYKTFIVPITI